MKSVNPGGAFRLGSAWTPLPEPAAWFSILPTGVPRRSLTTGNAAFWRPHLAAGLGRTPDDVRIEAPTGQPPSCRVDGVDRPMSYATTDGWRACAISMSSRIGIDIEMPREFPELSAMFERAGAPASFLDAASGFGWTPAVTFARLWTAKEAVLKAEGVGLQTDPRRVEIRPDSETAASGRFGQQGWTLRWAVSDEAIVAIALPAKRQSTA